MRDEISPEKRKAILEARKRVDPLVHYKPGPTVQRYLESDAKFRAITSGNQSGKTTGIQIECAMMLRGKHPYRPWFGPLRILVLVPSRAQGSVVWSKRLLKACELPGEIGKHPMIPAREIHKIHNTYSPMGPYAGSIELKPRDKNETAGSSVFFALSDDPNSWKRLEGMTFDYIFRDEAAGSENLSDELQPRLLKAQSDPKRPWAGGISWAATATKANDEWESFKNRCMDNLVTGVGRYEYFFIGPDENPAVSKEARAAMSETMSEESFKIRGTGEASAAESLHIFQNWSRDRHIRKTPYIIDPSDNLYISYDPGLRHPCGILKVAVNRNNPQKLIVVGFHSVKDETRGEHALNMAQWLNGRWCEMIVCDPSIMKRESNGISYYTAFSQDLQDAGIKMRVPLARGRNRNEDMFPQIETYFEHDLIEVDPYGEGCKLFIHEIEAYRWQDGIGAKIYKKAKGGDEGPDCIKYLVSKLPFWHDNGPNLETGHTLAGSPVAGPILAAEPIYACEEDRVLAERLRLSAEYADESTGLTSDHVGLISF